MQYPVRTSRAWFDIGRRTAWRSIVVALRDARYRRQARNLPQVDLRALRKNAAPLGGNDIVLLCVARNAEQYLPSLLAHYRKLGIARFAFVDDKSDDRTRDMLLASPDVDVFQSDAGFRDSDGGKLWRDLLLDIYGRDRWYVSIDSDEYLVFPGSEDRPLAAFIADLERHDLKRSLAAMIDIYPDAPLDRTPPHLPPDAPPTDVCPLFDGDSYRIENETFCTAIRGGPRLRLFGTDMRLTKFPVIFADAATRFGGASHHGPFPFHRNFSAVQSVLLHYKFNAASVADFNTIATRASHAGGSQFYRDIVGHAAFHDATDFRYPGSLAYAGSQALVDRGFMQDLRERERSC